LRCLRQGLAKIDLLEEPALFVAGRHNLIDFLNDFGKSSEALQALEDSRSLYAELGKPMHRVRLRWVEGKIARDLSRFDEAEIALSDARAAFVEHRLGFDAALVSLDLAVTYLRQGKTAAVKSLASEMIPIFEAHDIHAEAIAALLLFCRAAESDELTVTWLDRLSTYLRQARHDRSLRFLGAGIEAKPFDP
jgi:tetratricopeptide (TPR) repeat protein